MTDSDQLISDTWEYVCKWYRPERVHRSVQNDVANIPSKEDLETFSRWLTEQYRLAMRKGIELAIGAVNERIEELEAELAEANRLKTLYGQSFSEAQAELGELRSPRVRAMVLVYVPELTHSVWQDYAGMVDEETGEEIPRSHDEMIEDLRSGVAKGDWVAWRLVQIQMEVMGNEQR